MKYLFLAIAVVLVVLAVGTYLSFPDVRTDRPVVYWVTDRNPAREQQVEIFHEWLKKNGHVDKDGNPVVELRLDVANRDPAKQIIQSVSGVGGDIMDVFNGQGMRLFQEMSIIQDVTDYATKYGFGMSQTYAALEPELLRDGRQYAFPCNVTALMYWVNVDVFEKYDMQLPPQRWDFETFERMAIEFRQKANPEGTRPSERKFFCNNVNPTLMHRSLGLSVFNETLTACDLDDERYARTLELQYKWIYDDNILPTPDDIDAFATQEGYGGSTMALFGRGNFALVSGGRYFLIRFRDFENLGELRVVEPPHGGFPNTSIGTRAATLYTGSDHPDLAALFMAYLASEDYNMHVVHDADALPPNPKYTRLPAFAEPAKYPNEKHAHRPFADAATSIAIGAVYSPFILRTKVNERIRFYSQDFTARRITAAQAGALTAEQIDQRIADNLRRKTHLQAEYDRRVAIQKQIDERLAAGQKVPAAWINNVFYRRYYAEQGMLEDHSNGEPSAE